MANLIDDEEYDPLYFSDMVSPTMCSEKFDFKEFRNHRKSYIQSLSIEYRKILCQLLLHYVSIVQGVYGRDFIEHIPRMMYNLLYEFDILSIYGSNKSKFNVFSTESYRRMIQKNYKRYECENAYLYAKPVRVMEYSDIVNRLVIRRSSKPKPRMLKQIAAEIYINSKQWIYTSVLDLIQHNFKDLFFSSNIIETYTFYDVLLIKFVFQYFLKRNDTNFHIFELICKCTYGLKNKNHVKYESPDRFYSFKDACVLCNAIESRVLKRYLYREHSGICLCED